MATGRKVDALGAIRADLSVQQRRRRAQFLPALVLTGVVVVAALVIRSVRPDLLDQPPAQLALQLLLWGLCLFVFPAIGVGLLFPSRWSRLAIAVAGIAATAAATTGFPFRDDWSAHLHGGGHGGCLALVFATGLLVIGIGFLSGAFVQRRRITAVFWVSAGAALVGLNVVTWHCPHSGLMHVLPGHVGGALLLLVIAVGIGIWTRRRFR